MIANDVEVADEPRLAAEQMFSVFTRKTLEHYLMVITDMLVRDEETPFLPAEKPPRPSSV